MFDDFFLVKAYENFLHVRFVEDDIILSFFIIFYYIDITVVRKQKDSDFRSCRSY